MDADKKLEYLRGLEKLKQAKVKAEDYVSPLEQDVMKVKGGGEWDDDFVKKFKDSTEHIDTRGKAMPLISGAAHSNKIAALRALKAAGKKVAGIIPFAGAGMAALSGEPAMAAEELAQDAMGPAGLAYEAIRPTESGNPEEERQMLAEQNQFRKSLDSQAAKDRSAAIYKKVKDSSDASSEAIVKEDKLKKLKALMGKGND